MEVWPVLQPGIVGSCFGAGRAWRGTLSSKRGCTRKPGLAPCPCPGRQRRACPTAPDEPSRPTPAPVVTPNRLGDVYTLDFCASLDDHETHLTATMCRTPTAS